MGRPSFQHRPCLPGRPVLKASLILILILLLCIRRCGRASWLTRKITPTTSLQELENELDDQEVFAKWDPRFDFLARLELGEWSD